jgi:hypothetical protein
MAAPRLRVVARICYWFSFNAFALANVTLHGQEWQEDSQFAPCDYGAAECGDVSCD